MRREGFMKFISRMTLINLGLGPAVGKDRALILDRISAHQRISAFLVLFAAIDGFEADLWAHPKVEVTLN